MVPFMRRHPIATKVADRWKVVSETVVGQLVCEDLQICFRHRVANAFVLGAELGQDRVLRRECSLVGARDAAGLELLLPIRREGRIEPESNLLTDQFTPCLKSR